MTKKQKQTSATNKRYVAKKRKATPAWSAWRGMKKRCYYENHPHYKYYGGKGVTVCDRWLEHTTGFPNFL